jgi:hypothetical protein
MTNLHSAQLDLPSGAHAPDPWDHGGGVQLKLDHVISKDAQGKPLSSVGDFVWNWTYCTARKTPSSLPFYFWKTKGKQTVRGGDVTAQRLALMREMQYLMVLRVYHAQRILGFRSLGIDIFALGKFARYAHEKRCSLRDVLEQSTLLDGYITNVPASQCHNVVRWLTFLREDVTEAQLGFVLAMPKKWAELKKRANAYGRSQSQTAPLPTRIYLALINALDSELDDVEKHQDRLLAALREAVILHREYKDKGLKMGASFGPELIAKHGLVEFLTRKGVEADLGGLTSALTNIQRVCKLQAHTFSGMRDEEAENLPYHCMETVKAGHGRKHSLFVGATTKLNGARFKRTRWVTTDAQGFRAVMVAQSFADVIYEYLGVEPSSIEKAKDSYPLFVSTSYLPWVAILEIPKDSRYAPARALHICAMSEILKVAMCPTIEAADIAELVAIDEFRDWGAEPGFAIGMPWPLKYHQLRRSLALYCNASGLVKTSSLRRQLQHITREMSEYYGRGSVFAKNFLRDDPVEYRNHIILDWQDSEQEAQYLAFTRDVLNSDEPLCGPGGFFYDLKRQRGEVMSAQAVKDQLKMGRLAYKSHPLGGCNHVGICDKQKGLRLTSGICISENCKSLIGKHSNIIKIIPLQRQIVARLEPGSIVFDMEKEELDILVDAEVKWRVANRPKTAFQEGVNV